jgi:hypothetical protein
MKVLVRVFDPKPEHNLGEKSGLDRGVKEQLVETRLEYVILGQQVANSTVGIGAPLTKRRPAGRTPIFQRNGNAGGWPADGRIKDMGGNRTHSLSNLLNLRRVIRRCCSAAFRISPSTSFSMRRRRMSSISFAVLPVAQTMKV